MDQSGGATARSGGAHTANVDSDNELRSKHTSGCLSFSEPQGTYLEVAEKLRMPEQLRRRRAAAAGMVATWRSQPERNQRDRVIKMGPTPPTDATRERNRREVDSPAAEKKRGACGRIGENSKLAASCTNEPKSSEAKASPRPEGAKGARLREGETPGYRLHRRPPRAAMAVEGFGRQGALRLQWLQGGAMGVLKENKEGGNELK